jgi:hypothetical protein
MIFLPFTSISKYSISGNSFTISRGNVSWFFDVFFASIPYLLTVRLPYIPHSVKGKNKIQGIGIMGNVYLFQLKSFYPPPSLRDTSARGGHFELRHSLYVGMTGRVTITNSVADFF